MIVSELIEILEKLPQTVEVFVNDNLNGQIYYPECVVIQVNT